MSDALTSFGDAARLFGGAASDLFSASGYDKAAQGYGAEEQAYLQAAGIMGENITLEDSLKALTKTSTDIQLGAAQRQQFKVIGGAQADVASAGLEEHGSVLDSIRASMTEGAIQNQLIKTSGAMALKQEDIQQQSFKVQQSAYQGEAAAALGAQGQAEAAKSSANASAAGSGVGGILKVIGGIASIFGF